MMLPIQLHYYSTGLKKIKFKLYEYSYVTFYQAKSFYSSACNGHMSNKAAAKSLATKGCKSSSPSPTPINFTGIDN